jgi:PilZ domain
MANVERRRSARVPAFQEEAAVIVAGGRELPVKIVDLSKCGALVNVVDMPALGVCEFDTDQRLELSIQHKKSVFHVLARVTRSGPLFLALEFIDEKQDVRTKLDEKLSFVRSRNSESGFAKGVVGSA